MDFRNVWLNDIECIKTNNFNKLDRDIKMLERRLSVSKEIKKQGAKAVADILVS